MRQRIPNVTVCMPNYNYGHFVGQAIQSVLDQDFDDFELIIVDDCSTDNSDAVIRSFSDGRIRYYRNKANIGRLKNINKCIQLSRGKYITILPSDDLYTPDSLDKRKEVLDSNPSVGLVFSSALIIDERGEIVRKSCPFNNSWVKKGEEVFQSLVLGNYIGTLTCMVRKSCFDRLGLLNENIKATGSRDWEMWLRTSLFYDVAYISSSLGFERVHAGNANMYYRYSPAGWKNRYAILEHVFTKLPAEKKYLSSLKKQAVKVLADRILRTAFGNLMRNQTNFAKGNAALAIAINKELAKDWRTRVFYFLALFGKWNRVIEKVPKFIKRTIRSFLFRGK
ncbi:glycosyltransferase [bacterium]|nr:glycosyltransferase [bacterium]